MPKSLNPTLVFRALKPARNVSLSSASRPVFHHPWLRRVSSVVLGVSLLAGCNAAPPPVAETSTPMTLPPIPPATPTPPSPPAPVAQIPTPTPTPTPQAPLISAEGIGTARLGMTYGEFKQRMEPGVTFEVQSPFMVDFDAIAVSRNNAVEYYILYLAGTTFSDRDVIQGLLTNNPNFKTAEGIGTGTSLRQAETAYGQPTLSYHTQNESREYARFQNQPAPNISFATGNGNATTAGIYPSPTAEFNETQQYREDATIESILVVCLSESCAPP